MKDSAQGELGASTHHHDIIIIGAGISGINLAYRVQTSLPDADFTVLEGRSDLGGTWSLFKYPGVRSDTDLHTYGFSFNPWDKPNEIATGSSIIEYMHETTQKFGLDEKIRFRHKVVSADWRSSEQRWRIEVDNEGRRKIFWAKFVMMGTGYYDYDKPLEASIPGLERFKGTTVHPQFWPKNFDYRDTKMVIIGSGATAITMLPALVEGGARSVTQLQRSPGYILNIPQRKPGSPSPYWQRLLPRWMVLRLLRLQFIVLPYLLYYICRAFPNFARRRLYSEARKALPKDFQMDPHLQPKYDPWDQRMCMTPDNEYFKAFESGRAQIVTDTIKSVVEDGIELNSGDKLEADIIVTATGLKLQSCGGIPLTIDSAAVHIPDCYMWRGSLMSGVPNLGMVSGYINASFTLGADSSARLLMRVYKHMMENNYTKVTPIISEEEKKIPPPFLKFTSTYIREGWTNLPRSAGVGPWKPKRNYIVDTWAANRAELKEGLEFEKIET